MAASKRVFKTSRVLSGVRTIYRAWNDWAEGDVLIGTLKGTSQNKKNTSKKDWIVQVEDAFFSDKKEQKRVIGQTLTLNCAGQLDKGMTQLKMGDMFQVTYNGNKEMEGGAYAGQSAHLMEVVEVNEGEDDEEETEEEIEEEEEEDDDDL